MRRFKNGLAFRDSTLLPLVLSFRGSCPGSLYLCEGYSRHVRAGDDDQPAFPRQTSPSLYRIQVVAERGNP